MSMEQQPSQHNDPVLDWDLAIRLAGNKQELAKEMLAFFIKILPEEFSGIKLASDKNNRTELKRRLHKLYGALCYCGLPRLKKALSELEKEVKVDNDKMIPQLFANLEHEVNQVLSLEKTSE